MLEIILLVALGNKIAAKAREKGRSGGLFVVLLLVLWFGCEIGAMIVAMAVLGDGDDAFLMAYVAALVGAALGAVIAFAIVGSLPPIKQYGDYDDDRDRF